MCALEVIDVDQSSSREVFAEPDLVFVNYDLNTHTFIVGPNDRFVSLVDWEKARVAPTVQDIAHFLLPTTTLWRSSTATLLTPDQEASYLGTYLSERPHLDQDRFMLQVSAMKRLIALRAISSCMGVMIRISGDLQHRDAGTQQQGISLARVP